MNARRRWWSAALLGAALVACTEPAQQTGSGGRNDVEAYRGAPDGQVAAGWTAGDRASWEAQMRQRAQSQNEYLRIGGR